MAFVRKLDPRKISSLRSEKLFCSKLQTDKDVFPAIRNNIVDFYYKGGKLFEYRAVEFKTHFKYTILQEQIEQFEISEKSNFTVPLSVDFEVDYRRIKSNCKTYSGIESAGVSDVYKKHSYRNITDEIVVLDIEISFDALSKNKQDRIDLLLFNKKTKSLKFVEAKHFTNSELWSKKGRKPKVIAQQIPKYQAQVASKEQVIISQYQNYVRIVNSLFSLNLPLPKTVENKVILFIFGYDSDQIKGGSRFVELILDDQALTGTYYYTVGNPNNTNMSSLWKGKRI